MLASIICRVAGHKVDRRRVWNDEIDFRTICTRCGQPLLRGDTAWRAYDPGQDDDPRRGPHPRDRA